MNPTVHKSAAVLLMLASVSVLYLMVLRIDNGKTYVYDLDPEPDAAEYFAGGVSLADEGVYRIHVGGLSLPPRYPFGYSLMMLPGFQMGVEPIQVPFLVNRAMALGILLGLFITLWAYKQYLAAGLAPLMASTLPAFIIFARSPMSEISGAFVLLLGLTAIVVYWTHNFRWCGVSGALLLGLSVWFRVLNMPLAVLVLLIAPLLKSAQTRRRRFADLGILLVSFLAALMPLIVYQYRVFGNPFLTGYHFWTALGTKATFLFHFDFVPLNLTYLLKEVFQREDNYNTANLFGEGSYFGPALVVLLVILVLTFRKQRIFYLFALPSCVYLALLFLYTFQDARFYFPVLILTVVGASLALPVVAKKTSWLNRVMLLLLLLSQLSMFPGRKLDPDFERYLRAGSLHWKTARKYALVRSFSEFRHPGEALILTDMSPPYVYALAEGKRVVLPITEDHSYRHVREVDVGRDRLLKQFDRAISEGWGVYAIVSQMPVKSIGDCWSAPESYRWKVLLLDQVSGGGIAELQPWENSSSGESGG